MRLVPGTPEMLRAELDSPEALAAALGADLPASWPPEFWDADAVGHMLRWLEAHPADAAWGFYYILEAPPAGADPAAARPFAAGAGGYKGAPDAAGAVELGYTVVPERRRRGYAREAVDGWLAHAFAAPRVARVLAHTLPALGPSIAVLRSAGFTFAGAGADPQEPSAVQYVLTREAYAG
ncbi:MAG: GNAT family N-acetyltransferase [Myxococcales bacterium]|nr:GNAT family N-acetyltransferase [Myxococcales bacterium]